MRDAPPAGLAPAPAAALRDATVTLVAHLRQEIGVVGFWQNAYAQDVFASGSCSTSMASRSTARTCSSSIGYPRWPIGSSSWPGPTIRDWWVTHDDPVARPLSLADGLPARLVVGGLDFEVQLSGARRSIGITVERDGSLIVKAPRDCDEADLWLSRTTSGCGSTRSSPRRTCCSRVGQRKEFVSGEGFAYLGRSHRLLACRTAGRSREARSRPFGHAARLAVAGAGPQAIVDWYRTRALRWLPRRVEPWAHRMGVEPRAIEVRDLGVPMGFARQGAPRQLPLGHDPARADAGRLRHRARAGAHPRAESHAGFLGPRRTGDCRTTASSRMSWRALGSGLWLGEATRVPSSSNRRDRRDRQTCRGRRPHRWQTENGARVVHVSQVQRGLLPARVRLDAGERFELLDDLTGRFLDSFDEGHEREDTLTYRPYFLGPIVTNNRAGTLFLVDGQQRLTTLTLLLIYLLHIQSERPREERVEVEQYIASTRVGKWSFNLDVEDRRDCMKALLEGVPPVVPEGDESVANLWARYQDVEQLFPQELKEQKLPFFIDWLLERVAVVEIATSDQEMALEIFETMNDRGLRLTTTDMLKSYLLAMIAIPRRSNLPIACGEDASRR